MSFGGPESIQPVRDASLRAAARALARLDRHVLRAISAFRSLTGGILHGACTPAEAARLTIALFDHSLARSDPERGLFDWERSWYAAVLPPAPARVLVTAAGAGREAIVLERQGYAVDALEPSSRGAAECARRLAPTSLVTAASYQDVARSILDGHLNSCATIARQTYDAIVLGWTSLTNVLVPTDRERLLMACDRICPSGPILASYWVGGVSPSRAGRLGRRIGEFLRRRGAPRLAPGVEFVPHAGFVVRIDERELAQVAGRLGRRFERAASAPFAHGTFVK
ncbi:MAG: hypothetical protein HY907_01585 [Deltaproteobacteria bacterium]|nr:hypothetical protein [Deltaproteobacteria bacterium]